MEKLLKEILDVLKDILKETVKNGEALTSLEEKLS